MLIYKQKEEEHMENIIEINRLTKNFGKHRGIENISFGVKRGEAFGFLGPNGAS